MVHPDWEGCALDSCVGALFRRPASAFPAYALDAPSLFGTLRAERLRPAGRAIGETHRSAGNVLEASGKASGAAEELAEEVTRFFIALRSGPLDRRRSNDASYKGPERRAGRRALPSDRAA